MADQSQFVNPGCPECEVLLADLLEGSLPQAEASAVERHVAGCDSCHATLDAARRGHAWLELLKHDDSVTPPTDLVSRILARTSGAEAENEPATPAATKTATPWSSVNLAAVRGRSWYQPRLLLVAAMALFSVTLTMNVAGIHAADLKPGNLRHTVTRQYYSANARVSRYYANLRVVYEVESRVREFRRASEAQPSPANTQPEPQRTPRQKAKGKDGGSLQRPLLPTGQDSIANHDQEPAAEQDSLDARRSEAPMTQQRSEA